MKRILVTVLLLVAACAPIVAQQAGAMAVGVDLSLVRDGGDVDGLSYSTTTLVVEPRLRYPLEDALAVEPFVIVSRRTERDPDDARVTVAEELNQLSIGAGVAATLTPVTTGLFRLSGALELQTLLNLEPSGTSAVDNEGYFDLDTRLDALVFLDILLFERLFLRVSQPVARLVYDVQRIEPTPGAVTWTSLFEIDSLFSGFAPSFGVFVSL